jgi:Bardet-Biedl syndrome 9 protein
MSLFKTRDIWSCSCDNDLFDLGCLNVANLGANKRNYYSIITGSYNGFLRIYNPTTTLDNKKSSQSSSMTTTTADLDSNFKAHDLISEMSFPSPIIQIETGRFVSTTKKNHIAVLMPKKLAVYEVLSYGEGNVSHGNQYQLKLVYEHNLQRSAFNMCKGSFGGVNGNSGGDQPAHEYICVQSMDGMLSVFEYESFSISCFLPKCLIPGPIKYIPRTDCFVTVSSSWELESYKYQTLATSAKSFERNSNETSGTKLKRLLPEYTFNLGEQAMNIQVHNQQIIVLGERNLFCFTEQLVLKFMKKFDYNPSAFCVYPNESSLQSNSISYIVSTHSKCLFVHQDLRVKWAAQVDHVPVQICVAKINETKGIIVSLSEDGKLKCSYLGTEPALLNPIMKDDSSSKFNYKTGEEDYRNLQAQIKNAIMSTGSIINNTSIGSSRSGLQLSVDVPSKLDAQNSFNRVKETELSDPIDAIPSLTCKITLKCHAETANNIKLSINCAAPLEAVPSVVSYASIGSIPFEQDICFYMKTKHIPSSLNVSACASYTLGSSSAGTPRVVEAKFRLPLKLVMKSGQQNVKPDDGGGGSSSSSFGSNLSDSKIKKLTFETSKPCLNLIDLFPEFSSSHIPSNGNCLAAQFYGHPQINILIQGSKSGASRYRLQSETSMDALWLLTEEFLQRLNSYYAKQSQTIEIVYKESLPFDDFRDIIDRHLQLRQYIERYKEMLEQTSAQFRAVQKRLLIKFKDKGPTSLENMDALLEATYKQILNLSDSYLNTQKDLSLTANSLNCMSSLYVVLLGLAFRLNKESVQILEKTLTSQTGDTPDLGWEEIVNAASTTLIKHALSTSKNSSNKFDTSNNQTHLKIPIDSSKIEKQLKQIVSKFESGSSLQLEIFKNGGNSSIISNMNVNDIGEDKSINSIVSKLAEAPLPPPNQRIIERNEFEQPKEQVSKPTPPPPPTAAKNRFTMGEDYEDEIESEANLLNNTKNNNNNTEQSRNSAGEGPPTVMDRKPFGIQKKLPTFDELMQQELNSKTDDNWNDDD